MSTSDSDTPDTPERTTADSSSLPPAAVSPTPAQTDPAPEPAPDPVVATAPVAEPTGQPADASADTADGGPAAPVAVAAPVLSPAPVPAVVLPVSTPAASSGTDAAGAPAAASAPETTPTAVPETTPAPHDSPATTPANVPTTTDRSEDLFPPGSAPFTTSVGSHVVGVVVGALLAPVGMALALLGQSRILVAQVDGWDATADIAGIVLVTVGLLLLATVLVLTLWTPAVSISGGVLLTAAGVVYLFAPRVAREQTLVLLPSEHWHVTLTQVTVAGTSGTVLVGGLLLLVSGVVAVVVRRHGIHVGVFRERHHPGRSTLPPPKDGRTTAGGTPTTA